MIKKVRPALHLLWRGKEYKSRTHPVHNKIKRGCIHLYLSLGFRINWSFFYRRNAAKQYTIIKNYAIGYIS